MKKNLKNVFLFVIVLAAFNLSAASLTGTCIRITDGDSIAIWVHNKVIDVELEGIDCPEISQDFGKEAKDFTSSKTFKKKVTVHIKSYDSEGRVVGRAFVDDKDLSLELVNAGLAWHDKKHNSDKILSKAQKRAKKNKTGLWSKPKPTAPWLYRKTQEETNPDKSE
jgi:endonuclease YncB( thermonuclease family)